MPTLQRHIVPAETEAGRFEWLSGRPIVSGGAIRATWTQELPQTEADRHPVTFEEAHAFAGLLAAVAPDEGIIATYINEAPPAVRRDDMEAMKRMRDAAIAIAAEIEASK